MNPEIKIYHILHVDRLASVVSDGALWSDAAMRSRGQVGTGIGIAEIKERRLRKHLSSHPDLAVGDCVPFYFCPRSVMLFLLHRGNHPVLSYHGGQEPIVHLEADFWNVVRWANSNGLRFAMTKQNAGSFYFDDFSDVSKIQELDWSAIHSRDWRQCKEGKQAEFLIESRFEWKLFERIGVQNETTMDAVLHAIHSADHKPSVEIIPEWYY